MATFASRPTEHADPWYAPREAYDQSLEDAITANETALGAKADAAALTAHTGDTANPHGVTKAQVGLGSVDNTSDAAKPISTATQAALNAKLATADAPELIRDTMGAALVAGANVTITPNDAADTITIAASGGGGDAALVPVFNATFISTLTHGYGATGTTQTSNLVADRMYLMPLFLGEATTRNQFTIEVTTAAAAGGAARIGVFSRAGGTFTLVADLGTVATDAVGNASLSATHAFGAGEWWIGVMLSANCSLRTFLPTRGGYAHVPAGTRTGMRVAAPYGPLASSYSGVTFDAGVYPIAMQIRE